MTGNKPSVSDFCATCLYVNSKSYHPDLFKRIKIYDALEKYFSMVESMIMEKAKDGGFAQSQPSEDESDLEPIELEKIIDEDGKDGILNAWMGHKDDDDH